MQAVAATDVTTQFTAELQQAQRDALQTIHRIMLHLAQSITSPAGNEHDEGSEGDVQARTTTQRIRLCLQAARDILRYVPATSESGPSPRSRGEGARRSYGGRMRGHRDSPNPPANASAPPPSSAQRETVRAGAQRTNAGNHPAMRSINPLPPEQGRMPCDAQRSEAEPEVNHRGLQGRHQHPAPLPNSPSPPSAPSSVPSVPSEPSVASPPLPPRPQYFTDQERQQILATMRAPHERLTQHLYDRIHEWNNYARAAELSPAFGIKYEDIEARKPLATEHAQSTPTSE